MKNAYKLLYCILLLLIFVAINYFIQSYFKPTFIIIVLYVITLPLFNLIIKKINNSKIASILSLIIINAMIIIISFYMGNYLFELIVDKVITQKTYFDIIIKNILSKFNMSFEDLWNNLSKISNPLFIKSATYTGEIVIVYFIGNVTVYFLLSDKNIVIELIKIFFPERYLLNIKKSMLNIKHLLTMEIIMVLASTLEILVGFLVLGIKDAFILSFICGLLDILPYVGTVIVFIPLIIYNIVIKQYFTAFGLIFLYILIGIVRQILEAKYIGNKFSIHPLLIILSLYIGIEMFGIFGLFIGPLYVIMAKEIILN